MMKLTIKCWMAALAAVLMFNLAAAPLKVGDAAPDFSLKGSDGKTYKLSELKGKTVVIAWYPKALTGGCTQECKSMKEAGAELRRFDVAYFGASVDEPEKNKEFSDKLELDFPLLSDPTKETAKAYGVLKPEGNMSNRWTFYIDKEGKIAYIDQDVKVQGYGETIVNKLKTMAIPPR